MDGGDYADFLRAKMVAARPAGFEVAAAEVNPGLKPHCRAIVPWAIAGGRRAIFASFGLHKTAMQIEIMRLIGKHRPGPRLIVLPLGVRREFMAEAAARFAGEFAVDLKFIRRDSEIEDGPVCLTNYESVRDGKLDPGRFTAASLDEAAVLRSYGSKTFQTFLPLFDPVPYKFVATATPSPNRLKELIHYAGFLGVMDTGQALTRFFQRNSEQAGDLTLYPHKEREFWLWVHSWAIFLQRPSDLGFSDEGYALPPLKVNWHEVRADRLALTEERDGQVSMFTGGLGITGAAREKRDSIALRVERAKAIIAADPAAHRIVWHDLEAERKALEAAIPGISTVYGSQDLDEQERRATDFADGRSRYLGAKPVMLGAGANFQRHCRRATFLGVGFKFADFIQAIHRIYRFGQAGEVEIDIIHTDAERGVVADLKAKWRQHEETLATMADIIRKYGLGRHDMADLLGRSFGVARVEASGEGWTVANNDAVEEARRLAGDSLGLIVTSIPFANHYEYSASYNDFGHTDDNDHFWLQMDYLTPELFRALAPGRLACIHVKDRILFGSVTGEGVPTVSPFHAEAIFHYRRHGFQFMGQITVVTDVVRENNQTYRLSYSEMLKDGTKMGVGSPEYVLLFRKPQSDRSKGYADVPVAHTRENYSLARWQIDAHALWRSSGNRQLRPDELADLGPGRLAALFPAETLKRIYDFDWHVRIGEELEARGRLPSSFMALAPGSADPFVWHDIQRMRTLNGEQARRNVEKHICPLQYDIVDRLIERYSNKGDLVYDPFGGLMTVPLRALMLGRRGGASELNPGYFLDGVHYLEMASRGEAIPDFFASTAEDADQLPTGEAAE